MFKKIKWRLLLILAIVIIAQVTVVPFLRVFSLAPDLCAALFIVLVVRFPNIHALSFALLIGFAKEVFSNDYVGVEIIPIAAVAVLISMCAKKVALEHRGFKIAFEFSVAFVHQLFYLVTIAFVVHSAAALFTQIGMAVGIALYTVLAVLALEPLAVKLIPRKTEQYELF